MPLCSHTDIFALSIWLYMVSSQDLLGRSVLVPPLPDPKPMAFIPFRMLASSCAIKELLLSLCVFLFSLHVSNRCGLFVITASNVGLEASAGLERRLEGRKGTDGRT